MATNTYVALQTTTVSGSATNLVTFTSIPQTYTDLVIVANYLGFTNAGMTTFVQLNGVTGSVYSSTSLEGTFNGASSGRYTTGIITGGIPTGGSNWGYLVGQATERFDIFNYANAVTQKTILSRFSQPTGNGYVQAVVGKWTGTSAITSVGIGTYGTGAFAVGSTFTLYGIAANTGVYPINPPVTGYSLWLDGSDLSSITQSSNLISQWNDKSGNGRNFTSSGSLRPTYVTNPVVNGLSTISFAGGQGLTTSTFPFGSSAFTAFTVQKTSGSGIYQGILEQNVSGGIGIGVSGATGYYSLFKARISPQDYSGNVSPTTTNYDVYVTKSAGMSGGAVTAAAYKNGTSIGSASFTGGSTANGAAVGYDGNTGDFTTMNLAEILVYPSQLSDADRNSVEAYLKTKWGTP